MHAASFGACSFSEGYVLANGAAVSSTDLPGECLYPPLRHMRAYTCQWHASASDGCAYMGFMCGNVCECARIPFSDVWCFSLHAPSDYAENISLRYSCCALGRRIHFSVHAAMVMTLLARSVFLQIERRILSGRLFFPVDL